MQFQSNSNNTFTGAITPSSITPNAAKQYTVRLTNTATSNGQLIGSAAIGIPAGFTNVSVVSVVAQPTPDAAVRSAVVRGLMRLEISATNYAKNRSCFSCHNQATPQSDRVWQGPLNHNSPRFAR